MSGTKAGAAKAQQTIKTKYGVTDDGKSAMHQRAGIEGSKHTPSESRGFAGNRELASTAGKIGGRISRKRKKKTV